MLNILTLSLALLSVGAPTVPASTPGPSFDDATVVPASIGDIGAAAVCTATADCALRSDVSCSDESSPASCHAVDTNCSTGLIGYVECNGSRTYCPSDSCECSSTCCNGDTRVVPTGLCCDTDPYGEIYRSETCVDGAWQADFICRVSPTCAAQGPSF